MTNSIRVGSFEFEAIVPGKSASIPAKIIGGLDFPNDTYSLSMLWTIPTGSSFCPEEHTFAHLLIVIEGQGEFFHNGRILPYSVGTSLDVKEHEPHCFSRVDSQTVVLQRQVYTSEHRRPSLERI